MGPARRTRDAQIWPQRPAPHAGADLPALLPVGAASHRAPSPAATAATLPIVRLDAGNLRAWGQALSGRSGSRSAGYCWPAPPTGQASPADPAMRLPTDPAERLARFEAVATRPAQHLARQLACVPYALTLPMMRLVQQQSQDPPAGLEHLAEVFSSGLLEPHDPDTAAPEPAWHFIGFDTEADPIGRSLRGRIGTSTAVGVVAGVSKVMRQQGRPGIAWHALIADPQVMARVPSKVLDPTERPFALIGINILQRLGGAWQRCGKQLLNELFTSTTRKPTSSPIRIPTPVAPEGFFEQNLTLQKRIVSCSRGLETIPNHDLVIMKEWDGGRVYHTTVAAGERYTPKLFERQTQLIGYHVNRSPHLTHRFEDQGRQLRDQIHSYNLVMELHFSVTDSRRLVEHLQEDPLRRIRQHACDVFGSAMDALSSEQLLEDRVDFNQIGKITCVRRIRGREVSNRAYLDAWAEHFGLALDSVHITRHFGLALDSVHITRKLSESDLAAARRQVERDRELRRRDIDQELDFDQQERDQEAHLRSLQGQRVLGVEQARNELLEALSKKVIEKASDVRSISEIKARLAEVSDVMHAAGGLAGSTESQGGGAGAHTATFPGGARLPAGDVPLLSHAAQDDEVLANLEQAVRIAYALQASDRTARHDFLAALLHFMAEGLTRPDAERMRPYRERLEQRLRAHAQALADDQLEFLSGLLEQFD